MEIEKIKNGIVNDSPFPHMIVDNIFESRLYSLMMGKWPHLDIMTNAPSGLKNRNWIYLYGHDPRKEDAHIKDLPPTDRHTFWHSIGYLLGETVFKQAFFDKFNLKMTASSFHSVRLITDVEGYSIERHPDGSSKVLSVLLYCPEDNKHPEWGTSIEGQTIPFIPNQMFAFAKTDNSFHWVNKITTSEVRRNQLLIVYEK